MTPAGFLERAASPLLYASQIYQRRWNQSIEDGARALAVVYHRVVSPRGESGVRFGVERGVSARTFEAQIRFLLRHFEPARAIDLTAGSGSGHLRFAVTFDDGYEDTLTVAAPILFRLGVPAIVFANSDFVGTDRLFWWERLGRLLRDAPAGPFRVADAFADTAARGSLPDVLSLRSPGERAHAHRTLSAAFMRLPAGEVEPTLDRVGEAAGLCPPESGRSVPLLDWEGLRRLRKLGFDVGAHGATHANLGCITDAEAAGEIGECVARITREMAAPVELFAYPYGCPENRSAVARRAIAAAGCRAAFTTDFGIVDTESDRWALPRIGLGRPWGFACALRVDAAVRAARRRHGAG